MTKKVLLLVSLLGAHSLATAAITISDFSITKTSLSFNFSGTMPDTEPVGGFNAVVFANIGGPGGYAFANTPGVVNPGITFAGSPAPVYVLTGNQTSGDYLAIIFSEALLVGASLSGAVSILWDDEIIDLTQIGNIDVYWGVDNSVPGTAQMTSGTYLTTVVVPEPSTYASIAGAALLGLVCVRRLRSKQQAS